MTPVAIALLVVSATIHASWNMLGKQKNPTPAFFLLANALGCLCLTPVFLTHMEAVSRFPTSTWVFLFITGLCQAIYYTGLAGAYSRGDMSVAYPLARSAPVLLVAGINLLIGKGHQLTEQSLFGFALIVLGGLLLPTKSLREWRARDYLHLSGLFALLAASGTAGYSIVDDAALRALRESDAGSIGRTNVTMIYALFEGLSSSLWLGIFVLTTSKGREAFGNIVRHQAGSALLAGIGIFLAYTLVLVAMGFATNVSYIVAFRQLSIPLGTFLGVTLLQEPRYPMKFAGVGVMLCGLVLVAIG